MPPGLLSYEQQVCYYTSCLLICRLVPLVVQTGEIQAKFYMTMSCFAFMNVQGSPVQSCYLARSILPSADLRARGWKWIV